MMKKINKIKIRNNKILIIKKKKFIAFKIKYYKIFIY